MLTPVLVFRIAPLFEQTRRSTRGWSVSRAMPWDLSSEHARNGLRFGNGSETLAVRQHGEEKNSLSGRAFLRVPIPASRSPLARPPRRGRIARRYLGGAQRDQMNVCTDSPNFRTLLAPACSVRVHGPALSSSVHDIEGNGLVPYAIGSGRRPASLSRNVNEAGGGRPPPGGGTKKMIPAGFPARSRSKFATIGRSVLEPENRLLK